MREDVEQLYATNIRMSVSAYEFLMRQSISPAALRQLRNSESPILDIDEVLRAISDSSKIPMPEPTHVKPKEEKKIEANSPIQPVESPAQRVESPVQSASASTAESPNLSARPSLSKIIESRAPLENSHTPSMPSPSSFSANRMRATSQPPPSASRPPPAPTPAPPWVSKKMIYDSDSASAPPMPAAAILTSTSAVTEVPIPIEVIRPSSFHAPAKDYAPHITIQEHRDVSGQSRCVGSVDDFVAYFRDRFTRECEILRSRPSNLTILRTDQLAAHGNEEARLLVMISDKRITKNGNLLLDAEDEQGPVRIIVSQKERQFEQMRTALKDDVVAIDGRMGPNFFSGKAITWPDLPLIRQPPHVEEDLAIAYLSDLHVGSRYFMEKPFKRFIRWLWGEEGHTELAGKVKYIIVAGDVCDGIGVYPSQEKELTIKDIYAQYEAFDRLVESLPDHVEVIVSPGNHDAVRRGEPQPYIPMDLIKTDVKKVGSPASLEIEGMKHLVYHGTSLDSVIANISGLSYAKPEGPMMEILKRRHLSPIYGENLIVPELRDYMMIDQEPDVLHMGHIHKNAATKYRGTLMINSGTFQERTDFQVKMGHIPTPGIVPILELKTQKLSHLKFLEDAL